MVRRLEPMGLAALHTCSCLFKRGRDDHIRIIYDFVDAFVVTGAGKVVIGEFVDRCRAKVTTTPALWDSDKVLRHGAC